MLWKIFFLALQSNGQPFVPTSVKGFEALALADQPLVKRTMAKLQKCIDSHKQPDFWIKKLLNMFKIAEYVQITLESFESFCSLKFAMVQIPLELAAKVAAAAPDLGYPTN